MKILHILNELRPSGAEVMLRCAAPLWSCEGVHVDVLSVGATVGPYAGALASAGYSIHHKPLDWSPGFIAWLCRLSRQYDIVHIHTERANFLYALVCRLLVSRKVVRTIHNNFLYSGRIRLKLRFQRYILKLLGVRHIAISRGVQENEAMRFDNQSQLIYNWFDTKRFAGMDSMSRTAARKRWGIGDNQIAVLMLGNCGPAKNHESVIEAIPEVARGGHDFVLLHAGLEDSARSEWCATKRLGVEQYVRFLGNVDDVPSLLAASDLFLMPSHYEGFSIACLEALAAGLPAVLSRRPGLIDLETFFSGLVYTDTNAASISNGLIHAFETLLPLQTDAQANRSIALGAFSPERGVKEYAAIYRELLCRN